MLVEQKQNKVTRPTSVYTLSAEETNQQTTELQNLITAGGLTPSADDLTQVTTAVGEVSKTALSPVVLVLQDLSIEAMNEREVVNANSLISATGSYRAVPLDLSANDKLTKLTASGTSGNLAKLGSVLVSNSAPFDNVTSPQIDVSYTELDSTDIVNLFNSMPYNVGYEVVGSPTITDGILSGLSASNYLKINPYIPAGDMEFQFAFNVGTLGTNCCACEFPGIFSVFIHSNSIKIWNFKNSSFPEIISSANVSANDDFVIKFVRTGTSYTYSWAKNGGSFSTPASLDLNQTQTGWAALGAPTTDFSRYYRGTIDLNNTYINIDGAPWFKSTPEMVKTCSVVGCTGTADLTQNDKDIALNKGWALTVA